MSLKEIKGQPKVVKILSNGIAFHKISHAYCFLGPRGVGKKNVAKELAKALNCERGKDDSCGECENCLLIDHDNHPDVTTIQPEGASIKIHQIRQLQKEASYKIDKGRKKVFLIDQAELITVQAANSLLRFLEEPLSSITIILLVENINLLLPTILSRCQIVHFAPKTHAFIVEELIEKGMPRNQANLVAHLRQELHNEESIQDEDQFAGLCERVIEWGEEIFSGKSSALITIQKDWVQKEIERNKGIIILDLFLLFLRDCLRNQGRSFPDQKGFELSMWKDINKKIYIKWDKSHMLFGIESVLYARRQLTRFVQSQSVLERMVLVIQEEFLRDKSDRSSL